MQRTSRSDFRTRRYCHEGPPSRFSLSTKRVTNSVRDCCRSKKPRPTLYATRKNMKAKTTYAGGAEEARVPRSEFITSTAGCGSEIEMRQRKNAQVMSVGMSRHWKSRTSVFGKQTFSMTESGITRRILPRLCGKSSVLAGPHTAYPA